MFRKIRTEIKIKLIILILENFQKRLLIKPRSYISCEENNNEFLQQKIEHNKIVIVWFTYLFEILYSVLKEKFKDKKMN